MVGKTDKFVCGMEILMILIIIAMFTPAIANAGCPGNTLYRSGAGCEAHETIDVRGCDDTRICPENNYYSILDLGGRVERCIACSSIDCGWREVTVDVNGESLNFDAKNCADPSTCRQWEVVRDIEADEFSGEICTSVKDPSCKDNESWIMSDEYRSTFSYCKGCATFGYWLLSQGKYEHPTLNFIFNPGGMESLITGHPMTNESVNLTFNAMVKACQNRIPMMRVRVSMINRSGNFESRITGIYVQHRTLDYTTSSARMIGMRIPGNQKVFKQNYTMRWDVNVYRAWAFRKRLREGIENVVSIKNLISKVPNLQSTDFSTATPEGLSVKAGREVIFYSPEFLAGVTGNLAPNMLTGQSSSLRKVNTTISVFDVNKIDGMEICNASDLETAYQTKRAETIEELMKVVGIVLGTTQFCTEEVSEINFTGNTTFRKEVRGVNVSTGEINVTQIPGYSFNNASDFIDYVGTSISNLTTVLEKLGPVPSPTRDEALSALNIIIAGCDSAMPSCQPYDFAIYMPNGLSGDVVNVTLRYRCWIDIPLVNLTFVINTVCDSTKLQDINWSHGELAGMNPKVLAACVYNWEECLMNPVELKYGGKTGNYYEVALCGFGPASRFLNTDAKSLYQSTGLDSGLNGTSVESNVTVYRACRDGENWVSHEENIAKSGSPAYGMPAGYYACNSSASQGYKGYHTVFKCVMGLDADENVNIGTSNEPFVKVVSRGELVRDENGQMYVCEHNTYAGYPLFLPDVLPPVIHTPETAYNVIYDQNQQVWVITFKHTNVEDVYDDNSAPSVGLSNVSVIKICPDPDCSQSVCEWRYLTDIGKTCPVNVDKCDFGIKKYYLVVWDKAGNRNYTALDIDIKAVDGCGGCTTNNDCLSGVCSRGVCTTSAHSVPQQYSFSVYPSSLDLPVGVERQIVVSVHNPNTFHDSVTVQLELEGCSQYTDAWFAGYKGTPNSRKLTVALPPKKSVKIPIIVYAEVFDPARTQCDLAITTKGFVYGKTMKKGVLINVKELVGAGVEEEAPEIGAVHIVIITFLSVLLMSVLRE